MDASRARAALLAAPLAAVLAAGEARAQSLAASDAPSPVAPAPEPARLLAEVRARNVAQDEPQAYVLLAWGLTSVAGGTLLGATGWGGERARWFGVNTIVWGAVDAALAIPWAIGAARERAAIPRDAALAGEAYRARRREAITRSSRQALVLGINAAVDVLYIVGGALLWYAGDQMGGTGGDFAVGAGIAAISQGAFLLVFDAAGWLLANGRTARLEGTPP